ncbi:MAG TPA: M1 family aminopeptidase, partial [Terriglobia bacterium]|nr:M1 family aminopeptidase [Terriglobia bacterium]
KLEGKDSLWTYGSSFHYPRSTTSWYPRHGYLSRSRFDVTYHHRKAHRVASVGVRVQEGPVQGTPDEWVTEWSVAEPVALITFVCGRFERHAEMTDVLGQQMPVEYYSPPGDIAPVKEDFILAEMGNAVRYFSSLFGRYPYGRLGGAFFPTDFGQGFPTLLLLPVKGSADRAEFAFMAHETAHQWWGNIVGWRSYRDQWLSEGFAEYSGILYVARRSNAKDADALLQDMRRELIQPAGTSTGIAKIKLHEVGPLILGSRLDSSQSNDAGSLIYSKGALILRMVHYLLSNPETRSDQGFFDMMKDFVDRHRNGLATTESFFQLAGEHFARSPIGQKYGMKDLNWFLAQWVYRTGLPSYNLEYKIESREGGGFTLKGFVNQSNVSEAWVMPLPLVLEFSGGRIARTTVLANGPKAPVELRLPEKPQKVHLDPDFWILTEKTSEKGN